MESICADYSEMSLIKLNNYSKYDAYMLGKILFKFFDDDNVIKKIFKDKIEIIENNKLELYFIRGCFDKNAIIYINPDTSKPVCYIHNLNNEVKEYIVNYMNIPYIFDDNILTYFDTNSIDFMGKIYNIEFNIEKSKNHKKYIELMSIKSNIKSLPNCYVYKTDNNAIIPFKANESDVGYDLTIIKLHKKISDIVSLYDTGIRLNIDHGYYVEIVPRSSITKSGYMLANNIGIIDNSYRNNLYVALIKVDPNAPEIQFPFRCCQLIFKTQVNMNIKESEIDFNITTRNLGGFGSSGH